MYCSVICTYVVPLRRPSIPIVRAIVRRVLRLGRAVRWTRGRGRTSSRCWPGGRSHWWFVGCSGRSAGGHWPTRCNWLHCARRTLHVLIEFRVGWTVYIVCLQVNTLIATTCFVGSSPSIGCVGCTGGGGISSDEKVGYGQSDEGSDYGCEDQSQEEGYTGSSTR